MSTPAASKRWTRPPLIGNRWLRWGLYVGVALYLIAAVSTLDVNWLRVLDGFTNSWRILEGFFAPDFTTRSRDIWQGMEESLTMTVTSTVVGCLISIPIGLGAARNVAPLPVYAVCRSIIAVSRAFQEIIIAILFVA
ncbi:MAG: phosphonate ABC transporter, permease protein PhnE, partial [Pseudomonadota bacterium]